MVIGVIITLLLMRRRISASKTDTKRKSTRQQPEKPKRSDDIKVREISKLLAAMTATLNYQRVLDSALDLSMQALVEPGEISNGLVSAVLLFSEDESRAPELYVGAARRFTRSDMAISFPAQRGLLKEVIDEGGPILTRDFVQDPELSRIVALQNCRSAYCIPLRTGLEIYGALLFAHPDTSFFAAATREILDLLGNQAMIAIQNARLYQNLEQEKERMMDIQEEARKKLARDLHDGPTQSIAAIAMRVNFARRLMERDVKAAADELYKIEDLARRTTKEIRHMLFTLRPLVLESQGLTAAFESMAEKMKDTYNQSVIVDVDEDVVKQLEMGKQGVIFAIADEATTNARKHAEAEYIWVRLKSVQMDIAVLEIEDNGAGFDVGNVDASYEHRGSLGLLNMRERAELLNGIITIDSSKGKGTRIQVIIPLSEEAADRIWRGV